MEIFFKLRHQVLWRKHPNFGFGVPAIDVGFPVAVACFLKVDVIMLQFVAVNTTGGY